MLVYYRRMRQLMAVWLGRVCGHGFECCTDPVNIPVCNGCVDYGDFDLQFGVNTQHYCETYVNPLQCDDDSLQICLEATLPKMNSGCGANIGGNQAVQIKTWFCLYDTCD